MKSLLLAAAILLAPIPAGAEGEDEHPLALSYQREVDRGIDIPPEIRTRYAQLLDTTLQDARSDLDVSQYAALVDRNPHVQAMLVYFLDASTAPHAWHFIGASPVSTGKPGRFEHFVTPTGVFPHSLDNPDFRAEGTKNKNGIRGYGARGMRVYDFGWVTAERGWGAGGRSVMRLQMHATDPDYLEARLGEAHSKGCIRIPASLNDFIDRYGLLDADYLRDAGEGKQNWILRRDRLPNPFPGRYLVVIDSEATSRPPWLTIRPLPKPESKLRR